MNGKFKSPIVITDDDGREIECDFLDLIEYNGEKFIALLPRVGTVDPAGPAILRFTETDDDDNDEIYETVEDDSVLDAVYNIFKEKYKDRFTFDD